MRQFGTANVETGRRPGWSNESMNPAEWFQNVQEYLREVSVEYRKITWPPQKEAMAGTIGVLVVVTVITVVLGVVDFGLAEIMRKVLE